MFGFLKGLFDSNEKQLKQVQLIVDKINALEKKVSRMELKDMRKMVSKMRKGLKPLVDRVPEEVKSSIKVRDFEKPLPDYERDIFVKLQEFVPELYAIIREITHRKYNRRHYDVQLLAGEILAQGNKLVELKTGEGKTQVFHLTTALYALVGRGAHVISVNDYLTRRDGEYAGHILCELGLSVGVITPQKSYKFVPDSELKEIKGEEVYEERMQVKIVNPGDVGGWNLAECSKKQAYKCDVVYGTNNEFGFDYLRDNMVPSIDRVVQKELYFCIIDEVDSVLIDEARTPLIISAPAEESNEMYIKFASIIPKLDVEKHYTIDEKAHSAVLTDEGIEVVEKILGVDNLWENSQYAHHLENALKSYTLYKRDDEYLVKDGKVFIVDQFTGRVLPGRRYSEGLHQAIEAKEGVEIKQESKTLATITFQNLFRLYKVLGGGSGTVMTEAEEFYKIYKLDSIAVPTNETVIRKDKTDRIYKDIQAKFKAVAEEIEEKHKKGQPILVGTTSIEASEGLSRMLEKIGVDHEVLNAKYHEREANIIAKAGQKDAVTIATNMAGRGTDIRLGKGVKKLGGLHVIGTERHEARRIDNQLRGRSGRQGDHGSSRFYVALDDEIMRMQGGEMIKGFMERTNIPDDMPIESKIVSSSIERAQKRMEGYHFDIRNNVVKYDDIMNQQREIFYTRRRNLIEKATFAERDILKEASVEEARKIKNARKSFKKWFVDEILTEIDDIVDLHLVEKGESNITKLIDDFLDLADDQMILAAFIRLAKSEPSLKIKAKDLEEFSYKKHLEFALQGRSKEDVRKLLHKIAREMVKAKEAELSERVFLNISKLVTLQAMDQLWSDHLNAMQDLREGIGLRGVAQRDPLVEYKNEAFNYFDSLIKSIHSRFTRRIFKVRRVEEKRPQLNVRTNVDQIQDILTGTREMADAVQKYLQKRSQNRDEKKKSRVKPKTIIKDRKIGRNDPCPCGSGKKYKKCCGKL